MRHTAFLCNKDFKNARAVLQYGNMVFFDFFVNLIATNTKSHSDVNLID